MSKVILKIPNHPDLEYKLNLLTNIVYLPGPDISITYKMIVDCDDRKIEMNGVFIDFDLLLDSINRISKFKKDNPDYWMDIDVRDTVEVIN